MNLKNYRTYLGLAGWILLSFLAGIIGSQFEPGSWYKLIAKPSWTPPNWLFPVVWPILYLCMGTAAWLVWKRSGFRAASRALSLFFAQLVLNALWSWLFFGLNRIGTGLAEIAVLWVAILATLLAFQKHSKAASLLMVPYLLWVGFAAALNYAIWLLN